MASPEISFLVDNETRDPLDVEVKQLKETNSMVEEFMLLANVEVAIKIYKDFPEFAVLRRHPKPPFSNFESLIKAAAHLVWDNFNLYNYFLLCSFYFICFREWN